MNYRYYRNRTAAVALATLFAVAPCVVRAQDGAKKADKPAQSAVAAKVTFATIAAAGPAVKKATPAANLAAAKKLVGKSASFTGTVDKAFAPRSNGVVILNFAKDYKSALSAIVRAKDFSKFPDLKRLEGKTILITGKVEDYQGQPQIVLTAPSQVKMLQ